MLLPTMSLSDIAENLLEYDAIYATLKHSPFEDFKLLCAAWKERTGNDVTFAEMDIMHEVYGP